MGSFHKWLHLLVPKIEIGDTDLYNVSANVLGTHDRFRSTRANDTDIAFDALVTGDAARRWSVDASGLTEIGDGTSNPDTKTWRDGASILATDSYVRIRPPDASTARAFTVLVIGESQNRVELGVNSSGVPRLAMGTGAAPLQIVGPRKTGWSTATGTAQRSTFATDTVTLTTWRERSRRL